MFMKPKYSILITNYNTANTIKASLESILSQIEDSDSFEVIVVDNMSNDGSERILREFESQGKIKLISARCSRGKGRQIAFENSKGQVLIINMDMDTIFKPRLKEVLKMYHQFEKKYEKFILSFNGGAVVSRKLVKEVGGWRDLQRGEDTELRWRLEMTGAVCVDSGINMIEQHFLSWEHKGILYTLYDKYVLLRDKLRVGKSMKELFFGEERNGRWKTVHGSIIYVVLLLVAKITYKFKPCYNTYNLYKKYKKGEGDGSKHRVNNMG